MRSLSFVAAAAIVRAVSAVNLYASSYDGNLTSFSLSDNATLSITSRDQGCGSSPSWLVLDKGNNALYCIDEGNATPYGTLTSYITSQNGKLTKAQHLNLTAPAPVSGAIFGGPSFRGMALSHYTGQVSTIAMSNATSMKLVQQLNFTGSTPPGPVPISQSGSREHEAILDPTGKYILMPDLGADMIRIFCWGPVTDNNTLAEHPSFKVEPGSGPRHATFWHADGMKNSTDNLYLFVITELTSTVTGYRVSYPAEGGMNFTQVYATNSFGGGQVPAGAKGAEIAVSPDNKFLVVSNRNDSTYSIPNYDPKNSTLEVSDSLGSFAINPNATLSFIGLRPAGGTFPRQFSMNKAGDMIAVGLQTSGRVVILGRNVTTGEIGNPVADSLLGLAPDFGPTCIIWDE